MRGAQGPGGSRSRDRARRVYAVRRVLAILILLLLLALIIPRACQAIIGSEDDGASREDRGQEKAAGAGDTEDATAEKADTADDDATDKKSGAGSEGTREDAEDQDDGAATDLGGVLTETLAERVVEPEGSGSDQNVAASGEATTDQPAQLPAGLGASDQQPASLQDAAGAQLAPVAQRAPADWHGTGSPDTAAPAEESPPEPPLSPARKPASGRMVASDRGLVVVNPAPRPVVKPAPAPDPGPIDVAPAAPVAAAPVPPTPVTNDIAFAAGGVATNSFGGGAVAAPVNNAAAVAGAGAGGGGAVVATGGFAGARGLP